MANNDDLLSVLLDNGPSSGTFFLILSRMKEEGKFQKVIQECLKALQIYPNDIHIRQLLADTYFAAGQISQAGKELELIATKINDLTISYKLLAGIYIKQGRNEDAVDILNIYITHHPDDSEAVHLLENLQPIMELPDEEPEPEPEPIAVPEEEIPEKTAFEKELEEAIPEEIGPEPEHEEGLYEEAVSEPEEEELPEIATATLAELYFDQGHLSEAISTYEKIIEQNPEDESSKSRLEELKTMLAKEEEPAAETVDPVKKKKEKMISTLESWLSAIQDDSKTGVSPT